MKYNKISVVIPAHNEAENIETCLKSVEKASKYIDIPVEIVVVINRCTDNTESIAENFEAEIVYEEAKNLSVIRNAGIKASSGDIIATIDADSYMSENMLAEIVQRLSSEKYVGGGVSVIPERLSLGILCSSMLFIPKLLMQRIWAGLFWFSRDAFMASGGFDEDLLSAEDVDFAKRLKNLATMRKQRYGLILNAYIVTSCRKFDIFGDWYFVKNPKLVKKLLRGKDRKAADHYFYDARSK